MDGWTYVGTNGRWRHGYKTKFFRINGLPHFLKYGALRASERAALLLSCYENLPNLLTTIKKGCPGSWLARLVLYKTDYWPREMHPSHEIHYPWTRTVPCNKNFFDKLFKTVFGIDLPHKPIPYKGALCLIAILLCWLQIQDKTSQKLGIHKDHGFLNMFFPLYSFSTMSSWVGIC